MSANKGNSPVVSWNLKLIWVPIIGWDPILDIFSENSIAPHKFEVSHKPRDFILNSLAFSFKESILTAPSHIEYWEWIFKWLNFLKLAYENSF